MNWKDAIKGCFKLLQYEISGELVDEITGHRFNAAILESQIAQGLEACLPESGGVDEMPQGLAVGQHLGLGHLTDRRADSTGVVNVDMGQDDVVDLIGTCVQFGQRGQEIRNG